MFTSTSTKCLAEGRAADRLIPFIRAAATISFAIVPSSLGFVIIAMSEHLIRSIMVGDDPEALVSELQQQFPGEAIEIDEDHDPALAAKVVELIQRSEPDLNLPLDVRGAGFELRVWDALKSVPPGTTANYTFLAEQIEAAGA